MNSDTDPDVSPNAEISPDRAKHPIKSRLADIHTKIYDTPSLILVFIVTYLLIATVGAIIWSIYTGFAIAMMTSGGSLIAVSLLTDNTDKHSYRERLIHILTGIVFISTGIFYIIFTPGT